MRARKFAFCGTREFLFNYLILFVSNAIILQVSKYCQ